MDVIEMLDEDNGGNGMKKKEQYYFIWTVGAGFDEYCTVTDKTRRAIIDLIQNEWSESSEIHTKNWKCWVMEYKYGRDIIGRQSIMYLYVRHKRNRSPSMPDHAWQVIKNIK
jgi:hypothetical protein